MLRKVLLTEKRSWDKLLPLVMFAYREIPQESTGFSPFELVYGRDIRGPLDVLREQWITSEQEPNDIATYVTQLHDRMQKAKEIVQEHLQKAQNKQKTWYDQRAREMNLSAGEQVLLLLPDCTKKFLRKWQGPFTVKRRIGQVNYEIVMDNQGHTKVFHINLLKKWHSRVADQEPCSYLCLEEEEDGGFTDRGSSGHKLEIITRSNLTARQSKQLHELLEQFPRVLSTQTGKTTLINHHILTTDCAPIRLRPYKIPHAYREEVLKELNEMEKAGIIQESDSSWAAPIAVVKKKDGRLRICVDYRKLNQVTQVDAYPMPRIDDLLDSVGQSTYITTLDLAKGYWQVPVAPEDRPKTAFTTPKGLFEFTTMPFGLQRAPATFQRLQFFEELRNLQKCI